MAVAVAQGAERAGFPLSNFRGEADLLTAAVEPPPEPAPARVLDLSAAGSAGGGGGGGIAAGGAGGAGASVGGGFWVPDERVDSCETARANPSHLLRCAAGKVLVLVAGTPLIGSNRSSGGCHSGMRPSCRQRFTLTRRRHHCRLCGKVFCGSCCPKVVAPGAEGSPPQRLCIDCAVVLGGMLANASDDSAAVNI